MVLIASDGARVRRDWEREECAEVNLENLSLEMCTVYSVLIRCRCTLMCEDFWVFERYGVGWEGWIFRVL